MKHTKSKFFKILEIMPSELHNGYYQTYYIYSGKKERDYEIFADDKYCYYLHILGFYL